MDCNFVCAGCVCVSVFVCAISCVQGSSASALSPLLHRAPSLLAGPHEWVYLASEASKQTRTLSLSCLCSLAALAQLSTLINALPVHLSDRFLSDPIF